MTAFTSSSATFHASPCLVTTVLLVIVTCACAQSSTPTPVNLINDNTSSTLNVSVSFNKTATYLLTFNNSSPASYITAYFASFDPKFPEAYDNGLPTILLSAYVKTDSRPTAEDCEDGKCKCGLPRASLPKDEPSSKVVDRFAFFSQLQNAFVRLEKINSGAEVYVELRNYPHVNLAHSNPKSSPSPVIRGRLQFRLVSSSKESCPGTLPSNSTVAVPQVSSKTLCSGKGDCSPEGKCLCKGLWTGPMCSQPMSGWPPIKPKDKRRKLSNGVVWTVREYRDDKRRYLWYNATIPPYATAVVRWNIRDRTVQRGSYRVTVLHGAVNGSVTPGSNGLKSRPTVRLFVQGDLRTRSCGRDMTDMPTRIDEEKEFNTRVVNKRKVFSICSYENGDDSVRMSIFADASGLLHRQVRSRRKHTVTVQVRMRSYDEQFCDGATQSFALPFYLLPVSLAIMGVAALIIVVILLIDRRHGFTRTVDRLSPEELVRMYPITKFESAGDVANTSTGGGLPECTVCLCPFEALDDVRRLNCEHIYHCECVDPWLTKEQASCPTCRAKVRIDELSDKRILRRVVRIVLWPLTAWQLMRERMRLWRRTQRELDAAERGMEHQVEISAAAVSETTGQEANGRIGGG